MARLVWLVVIMNRINKLKGSEIGCNISKLIDTLSLILFNFKRCQCLILFMRGLLSFFLLRFFLCFFWLQLFLWLQFLKHFLWLLIFCRQWALWWMLRFCSLLVHAIVNWVVDMLESSTCASAAAFRNVTHLFLNLNLNFLNDDIQYDQQ